MSDLEPMGRGRELASAVRLQLEQFTRCPFNREEGRRLDTLQSAFVEWANQHPEVATLSEFADQRLRPAPSKISDEQAYMIRRQQAALDVLRNQPERWDEFRQTKKTAHADSGFWSGIPGGAP